MNTTFNINKIKKSLVLIFLLCISLISNAQLEEQKGLRLSAIHYSYNNPNLPGNNGESHFSIALDVVNNRYGKGQTQFVYRIPVVSTAIPEVAKLIKGESAETVGETFLTSLLPGWFQFGYNVFANERICISPGFFAGDFWYTAYAEQQLFSVTDQHGIIEPSGWYGAIGPSLFFDVAPISDVPLSLHVETSYNFSKRWKESSKLKEWDNFDPDSEAPHFFTCRVEVRYNSLFVGYDYMKAINRYEATSDINNGTRAEIFLGVNF